MQLSPLQSRLAASLMASCLLIIIYFTLFSPHFAMALELQEPDQIVTDEPDIPSFDRSILARAPAGVTALTNNEAMPMNVVPGTTQFFVFTVLPTSSRSLELRSEHDGLLAPGEEEAVVAVEPPAGAQHRPLAKRQSSRMVYISANTCEQPRAVNVSTTAQSPPQLTLYVSTSPSNQSPGPLPGPVQRDVDDQVAIEFVEGAVMYNVTTTGDLFMGVSAPEIPSGFDGSFNFRLAASTDAYFYTYNVEDDADLIWVDSDSQGALLITHNLTQSSDPVIEQKVMSTQPYVMFAQNKNDTSIIGLMHSFCGLENHAQIAATKNGQFSAMVSTGMTKRGQGNLPKQQFFFTGLNSSSSYLGILARDGNLTSGNGQIAGGGHVFKATNFSTKSDHGNCAIIVDLEFCDQVAYSVPSNPNFGNATKLAKFYDNLAIQAYDNFNKSLAQVPCEADSTQRYSLVRNCTHCATAYKDWLCSILMPRCEDFDNPAPYLHPRAMAQPFPNGDTLDEATRAQFPLADTRAFRQSRVSQIDDIIKPGPYKELLPCEDLCYNIIQSCPASFNFGCPRPGVVGFNSSYARRDPSGLLTCNYPGSAHLESGARRAISSSPWAAVGFVLGAVIVLLI
ncbi:stretch-activated Ca2+-permeable channel component-domain-containing protein [Echria macrotheca]|uniref:Stretch-activated Ca2+-permeable channel component-domain-containing protein n=1 Tax=Echria macrotheca TaxID=438768 RepID=A0AAJ0BP64_9PEZI|nr:stretch-activated Ca2+-permeable channel component-domain-containing protein [Echria macrotheca]